MLKTWIEEVYSDKEIKISGEPYLNHLLFVANMAADVVSFGYEIGLCHDLLEDTGISGEGLYQKLLEFGYARYDASYITGIVGELTDVFTKDAYPQLSKKERKDNEAARLLGISSAAQSVKYCDLIYNIRWTLKYERKKAKKYLNKKKALIQKLDKGDLHLYGKVNNAIATALLLLSEKDPDS